MPSSSMRLISASSEKRGGGSVKCWSASTFSFARASPAAMAGSLPSWSSSSSSTP